jgi:hypothetical protein
MRARRQAAHVRALTMDMPATLHRNDGVNADRQAPRATVMRMPREVADRPHCRRPLSLSRVGLPTLTAAGPRVPARRTCRSPRTSRRVGRDADHRAGNCGDLGRVLQNRGLSGGRLANVRLAPASGRSGGIGGRLRGAINGSRREANRCPATAEGERRRCLGARRVVTAGSSPRRAAVSTLATQASGVAALQPDPRSGRERRGVAVTCDGLGHLRRWTRKIVPVA